MRLPYNRSLVGADMDLVTAGKTSGNAPDRSGLLSRLPATQKSLCSTAEFGLNAWYGVKRK